MSDKKYQEQRDTLRYAPKNGYARISTQDKDAMQSYAKR